jgi:hypothetical protein
MAAVQSTVANAGVSPGRALGRVLVVVWVVIAAALLLNGYAYYFGDRVQRAYTAAHALYAPTGRVGHVLGYIGALCIVVGVGMYVVRKRWHRLERAGRLSSWLQVHIFLCTMGPFLVLLHTSFKFGGLAAISFWSMTAAVISGIIGRYIYVRIPKSLNGSFRALESVEHELHEIGAQLEDAGIPPAATSPLPQPSGVWHAVMLAVRADFTRLAELRRMRRVLARQHADAATRRRALSLLSARTRVAQQVALLVPFQRLFRYWHVLHLPVAILMFLTLAIHVAVAITFGYAWPF